MITKYNLKAIILLFDIISPTNYKGTCGYKTTPKLTDNNVINALSENHNITHVCFSVMHHNSNY